MTTYNVVFHISVEVDTDSEDFDNTLNKALEIQDIFDSTLYPDYVSASIIDGGTGNEVYIEEITP